MCKRQIHVRFCHARNKGLPRPCSACKGLKGVAAPAKFILIECPFQVTFPTLPDALLGRKLSQTPSMSLISSVLFPYSAYLKYMTVLISESPYMYQLMQE